MSSELEGIELAELPFDTDFSAPSRRIVSAGSVTIASLPGVEPVDIPLVSIEAPGIEGLTGGGVEISASEFVTLTAGAGCGIQLLDAAGELTIEFPADGLLTIQSDDFNQMILMEAVGIQILTPETITMTTGECYVEINNETGVDIDCFGVSFLLIDEAGIQLGCYSSTFVATETAIAMASTTVSINGTIELTGETSITGAATITGGLIVA
ncbi:hypothetical protein Pan216_21350 [Planctomycetes bacterium Pan216]|uniref:Uncharacterized protein n=1 Tax=Kolteria novifilia TaxID=2527975 RepID=A0A518B2R2_9BACT|nr:hypothetical protein Pan216_21350 [Planctomycetes bacterium Pan216]